MSSVSSSSMIHLCIFFPFLPPFPSLQILTQLSSRKWEKNKVSDPFLKFQLPDKGLRSQLTETEDLLKCNYTKSEENSGCMASSKDLSDLHQSTVSISSLIKTMKNHCSKMSYHPMTLARDTKELCWSLQFQELCCMRQAPVGFLCPRCPRCQHNDGNFLHIPCCTANHGIRAFPCSREKSMRTRYGIILISNSDFLIMWRHKSLPGFWQNSTECGRLN